MTPDDAETQLLPTNLSKEAALDRVDAEDAFTPGDVRVVAAPKYLFDYEIRLDRPFISDRVVSLSTTVDGMTGAGYRNDAYPDLESGPLPEDTALEAKLDHEEATDRSDSVVRRYLNRQFASFIIIGKTPDVQTLREDFAYALYWLVPDGWYESTRPTVTVFDSSTGERLHQQVPLEDVTADLFTL